MTKKSVLVVEDDAILATHLVDILVQYGYDVQPPVATGDEAIKEAKRSEPDIILMDIRLIGEMSGITAAKKIRETMDIPVIYLTAYSDEQRLQEVMSSEPYGYLIKPVQNRELRMTIQIALYKHGIDRKLKESEERYRAVVTQANEAVILADQGTKKIIEANPAFIKLFGYYEHEIRDLTLYDIIDEAKESVDQMVGHILSEDHHNLGEQRYRTKDNSIIYVEVNSSVVRAEGRCLIICVIAHDVTDRKRTEEALKRANQKLNLLGSITRHDILNKLTVLMGNLFLIEKHVSDPDLSGMIARTLDSALQIKKQIEFTRTYQDLGITSPKWHNIESMLTEFKDGKIPVMVKTDDLEIFGDPLLEKVFYNLYDNCIRHSDKGSEIRVYYTKEPEYLSLLWEDNGIGVRDEDKLKIFERGFGNNTGLGLFLSSEILAITGITIRENGTAGKGARFEIIVPKDHYRFLKDQEKVSSPDGTDEE